MKNGKAGLFLLISQLFYLLLSVVWIIVALMSFMMFDSPEALSDVRTMSIFIFVWLYPLAVLGAGITSWVLFHKRKFKGAVWIGLIPIPWAVPLIWLTTNVF